MLIAALIPATILTAAWCVLLFMVDREDWITAALNKVLDDQWEVDKLHKKDAENAKKLATCRGLHAKVMGLFWGGGSEKKMTKLLQEADSLQKGDLRGVDILPMPGYVLLRRLPGIGRSGVYRSVLEKCIELYGKKYAANRAKQLVAQVLSYPIIGVAAALALGTILLGAGKKMEGIAVMLVGSLLVLGLVYALYDELNDRLNKRRKSISRQFPNVVSKLALLTTSGMIMGRAWRETAESQELELYQEMRRTADELDNLVEPAVAYTNFIDRCSTKETTKLASAIIQSQSKGNAEVGLLLKNMAHEAWQERRHTAKRDSEAANAKLMIPTILLFIAILVMIMVPVAMSFSAL